MTIYYVDSAAGSNTSPYNSWATAATSLGTIAGIDAAGDTIYVASTHSETGLAANPNYAWAGTIAAPTKIICADKTSGAPPATAATGATIGTASGITLTLNSTAGGVVYWYGFTLQSGTGTATASSINTSTGQGSQSTFDTCNLWLNNTSSTSSVGPAGSGSSAIFLSPSFKFGSVGQRIYPATYGCVVRIYSGSIDGTGSAVTALFALASGALIEATGFDVSNAAAAMNVVSQNTGNAIVRMTMCKLPGGWSGSPNGVTGGVGTVVIMDQCDSSGVTYTLNTEGDSGQITNNTTVVLSGGATDGTTPLSWTMASNAQALFPVTALKSEWRAVWVDTTTSKTLTWQYVADTNVAAGQGAGTGNAFQNNQVWIEAMYFGSSASPLGTIASSAPSTPLAAATDNAAGSGTWTTTGLTTPKQGECTLTFTTAMKGPMLARICVGAANKTIYADPAPTFA